MSTTPPTPAPHPRQPLWRIAISWLLPAVLLALAFRIGYRLGRQGLEPPLRDGIMLYDGPLPGAADRGTM